MIYKSSTHCPISLCLTSLWPFLAWSLFQVVLPLVSHPVSFFSSPASFSLQAQLSKTPAPPSALTGPHPALPALCAALVPKHIRKSISMPGCYRQGQKVQREWLLFCYLQDQQPKQWILLPKSPGHLSVK